MIDNKRKKVLSKRESLRKRRKVDRARDLEAKTKFAKNNPSPKLPKVIRMRVRDQIALLNGTMSPRKMMRYGLVDMDTPVEPGEILLNAEALALQEAIKKDPLIQRLMAEKGIENG